jgi:hypothetical protein
MNLFGRSKILSPRHTLYGLLAHLKLFVTKNSTLLFQKTNLIKRPTDIQSRSCDVLGEIKIIVV